MKSGRFITIEGVEGVGKSTNLSLIESLVSARGFEVLVTREPGGTFGAEKIRNIILKDYFNKKSKEQFDKYTDTLLYMAARNEHVKNKLKPAALKKQVVICDRFTDSTIAYQVYGKGVDKSLIDNVHKRILNNIRPNLTFLLKVNIKKALRRLNKRKTKNRYDKFSKNFYNKVQKSFIKIANRNKKKYHVYDNSEDNKNLEKIILKIVLKKLKNKNEK